MSKYMRQLQFLVLIFLWRYYEIKRFVDGLIVVKPSPQRFHYQYRDSTILFTSPSSWPESLTLNKIQNANELSEGCLVVSRVESSLGCHDLRQPYFHKAVVLILDHDVNDFTQGVLLNRASDLTLRDDDIIINDSDDDDDDNEEDFVIESTTSPTTTSSSTSSSWKIHFGGDIGGWFEDDPNFVCLHTMSSDIAMSVSDPIIFHDWNTKGIFITSLNGAQSLIESGEATSSDEFFTFCGFCGWESGQLQKEVDRGSWYMVSLSSSNASPEAPTNKDSVAGKLWQMIESFCWKNSKYKPQSAGIDFWTMITKQLGKENNELGDPESFSDLMLKEWATQRLLVNKDDDDNVLEIDDSDIFNALKVASDTDSIIPGILLRGSSSPNSPFLLKEQLFHKSTILLLQEDPDASIGVILNLPTTDVYTMVIREKNGGDGVSKINFPIRYGGPSGRKDIEQPLLWFHNNEVLKEEGIGRPLSTLVDNDDHEGIYVCLEEEVKIAMEDEISVFSQ